MSKSSPTLILFYNSNKVFVKKSLSQNDTQSFCSAESHRGGNIVPSPRGKVRMGAVCNIINLWITNTY